MHGRKSKGDLIDELISAFRASGNQDNAFDKLAAERLGVHDTDLHCLNIIENSGELSAGELATQAGLTPGAITGVIDRLDRAGFARRVRDPNDRRRVTVQVTPAFDKATEAIWGPMAADWRSTLAKRFSTEELERIIDFVHATTELGRRQTDRLRGTE